MARAYPRGDRGAFFDSPLPVDGGHPPLSPFASCAKNFLGHLWDAGTASNRSEDASNKEGAASNAHEDSGGGVLAQSEVVAGDTRSPKQRWSRKSYNAYQREYMRKRRERD